MTSTRPFPEVLAELRGEMTFAALAARSVSVDSEGRGVSSSYLSLVANGTERPAVRAMQLLAAALKVDPIVFAEYRLAAARAALDERNDGGLNAAIENLARVEAAAGTLSSDRVLLGTRKLAA